VLALQRENKEILWGSMVKETMKRKKPSFNETYYGFRTFSQLLEDAQRRGLVVLRRDQRSGSYIVEDLGQAATPGAGTRPPEAPAAGATPVSAAAGEAAEAANGGRTPRRRRGRSRRRVAAAPAELTGGLAADDDEDEGDEEYGPEGQEEPGAESEQPREAAEPAAPRADEAPKAEPPPPAPSRPFSLFSWIRRSPTPPAGTTENTTKDSSE
jgi:hypothetical protein